MRVRQCFVGNLPLLKEEVETWTPGRDRSTNLMGWSLKEDAG